MKKILLTAFSITLAYYSIGQAVTFNYTGAVQTYTVPPCVTTINIDVRGGQGMANTDNTSLGGLGGRVQATMTVVPGQVLQIYVGGGGVVSNAGGWNGGGNGGLSYQDWPQWQPSPACPAADGGGGGGGSDIRIAPYALANRVAVGGGGGGTGGDRMVGCGPGAGGGGGGGYYGGGGGGGYSGQPGTGGTQAVGGTAGGSPGCAIFGGLAGTNGALFQGGLGGNAPGNNQGGQAVGCQGGCGGTLTGGTGVDCTGDNCPGTWSGGSGGGGSNYASPVLAGITQTACFQNGNGEVIITPTVLGGFTLTTSQTNITCNGLTNGTATAIPNPVGVYTYSWSTVPPQTNATATGLSAGTYTVTVVNGGCTVTASVTITQPPAIIINNVVTNIKCNGANTGSIVATVNGGTPAYTYAWTPLGGNGATASNLSVGCYTLTVTDANGCIQTASACITQPAALTANVTTTLATCGSNNGTATVTVGGGTPGYNYIWSNGATSSVDNGLSTGSYTVTVTDANGCTITANANVSNAGGVTANISLVINEPCFGDNVGEIDITDAGGVPPYTYSWTNGATTQNITGLTAGGYTVTVTDQNGCNAVANATITQPPAVTAVIASTNIPCNGGATGSATVTAGGGTPGYNYLWSNGGTTSAINGLTAGIYNITVTDANGCTGTATVTLTQPTAITLTPANTNAFCGQPDGTATIVAGGGVPGYTYIWNNGATTSAINNLLPGNYCVTVTDANACTATACITVNNTPGETINISGVTDVSCNGLSNGSLQTTIVGGVGPYTFVWSNGASTQNVTGLSAGTYNVTVTDFHGCQATTIGIITQPAVLVATINGTQTICVSQNAVLNGIVNGGTLPYTYAWSNAGTTSSITVSPATTTTYTLTVTDANGCLSAPVTITVTVSPPITLVMGPQSWMCIGGQANISVVASGGDGNYAYNWMPGAETGQNANVSPATTTIYTVTVTDNCGSPAVTGTVSVTINPSPVIGFMADSVNGCSPLCATFINQTTLASGTMKSYLWNFGNGIHDTGSTINYDKCFPTPGKYDITLTGVSDSGCISTNTNAGMITVYTHPTANFTEAPQPTTIDNPAITFTDKSIDNYGLATWSWSFGDQTDSVSHSPTAIHTYQDTGTYCATLTVTNIHGCVDSTTNCLVIGPQFAIYIPSAFTPNGDGINDIFQAKGSYISSFTMYIFNRWGSLIYATTDINKGWDGAVNNSGPLCEEDTYIYLIQVTDNKANLYKYTGRVSLLK